MFWGMSSRGNGTPSLCQLTPSSVVSRTSAGEPSAGAVIATARFPPRSLAMSRIRRPSVPGAETNVQPPSVLVRTPAKVLTAMAPLSKIATDGETESAASVGSMTSSQTHCHFPPASFETRSPNEP